MVLLTNIKRLLRAKGLSADAISKKAGVPDAVRNLSRAVSGEKPGTWNLDTLYAIAKQLDVPAWELLRPAGAADHEAIRAIVREEMEADRRGTKPRQKIKR